MIGRPAAPVRYAASRRALCGLLAGVCLLSACGGAQVDAGPTAAAVADDGTSAATRYAAALRLGALARVEARAGLDEMASEHYRAAYRVHPELTFVLAQAQAAERARLYAEAHDAAARALMHRMTGEQRAALDGEVKRLAALVPQDLHRVAVQVAPDGARVELRLVRTAPAGDKKDPVAVASGPDRTVLTSGGIWLKAGTWNVESGARGYQSELRTIQVGRGGELLTVALKPDEAGPALAVSRKRPPVELQPGPKQAQPDPKAAPGPDVVRKVLPETEPGAEPKLQPQLPGPTVKFGYEEPPRRSALSRYGPIATSMLGVAALGVGGYFGYQATTYATTVNALQPGSKKYATDFAFYKAEIDANSKLANYAFIGGGALVAVGTLWWVVTMPAKAPPAVIGNVAPPAKPVADWRKVLPDAVVPGVGAVPSATMLWNY